MTEPEDFLGFGDPADKRASRGPAFYAPPMATTRELFVFEEMHRKGSADFPGAGEILFTCEDEETGEEIWDPPAAPAFRDEAKRWQRIMKWPTVPTVAEAVAFQNNAVAALLSAWWDRLAAARAEDDAERPPVKPKGRPQP